MFVTQLYKSNILYINFFFYYSNIYLIKFFLIFNFMYYYGKSYKIKKLITNKTKFNKYIFRMGRSHWCRLLIPYLFSNFVILKKRRNLFYIYFETIYIYKFFIKLFYKFGYINKYTKRGVGFKIKKFKKRYGKISQAFQGLH